MTALLTAIYSWRLIFKTFHGKYNNQKIPQSDVHESETVIILPLMCLVVGSIFTGYLFKDLLIGNNYEEFWGNSILFLQNIEHTHIPIWLLIITPLIVVISIPISFYLYIKNKNFLEKLKLNNKKVYNFLLNKWYFDEIYNHFLVQPLKKIGSFLWKTGDENTIDKYGPNGISKIVKIISSKAVKLQSGYIFDYAFIMLLGFSLLLTFFIIYK